MTELTVFNSRLKPQSSTYAGFTRPSNTLKKWATKRNHVSDTTLEDVRDELSTLNKILDPKDVTINLSQCLYDFTDGKAKLTPFGVNKLGHRVMGETLWFTTTGWNQWAKLVGLPRSGGNFIAETVKIPNIGPKQGTALAMIWAAQTDKLVVCRTHQYDGRRYIRACVSTSYGVYDNLMFVQDLLDEVGNQRVFRSQVTTSAMMLKLTPIDVSLDQMLGTWVPCLNGWNNEAGQGNTQLADAALNLKCTNGLHETQSHSHHRFRHSGSSQRVTDGIGAIASSIRARSSGLIAEYNSALEVAVGNNLDEAIEYMLSMTAGKISKAKQQEVATAMLDETSSNPLMLSCVVDGLTLAAQDWSIEEQQRAEMDAVRIMRQGLLTL